ncbi:MAG: hypothetical protein AAGJ97_02765, partial [Planctomycetota bacterium]
IVLLIVLARSIRDDAIAAAKPTASGPEEVVSVGVDPTPEPWTLPEAFDPYEPLAGLPAHDEIRPYRTPPGPVVRYVDPPPVPAPDDPNDALRVRLASLRQSLAAARTLRDEWAASLKDAGRKLQAVSAERAKLVAATERAAAKRDELVAASRRVAAERDRLAAALTKAEEEVENAPPQPPTKFEVIAHNGVGGATKRPLLIECRPDGLTFLAENLTLRAGDLDGYTPDANPFAAGVDALIGHWTARDGEPPHVLLLVRPGGSVAYYTARLLLQERNEGVGYELLSDDVELVTPERDAEARAVLERAVRSVPRPLDGLYAVIDRARRPVRLREGATGFEAADLFQDPTRSSTLGRRGPTDWVAPPADLARGDSAPGQQPFGTQGGTDGGDRLAAGPSGSGSGEFRRGPGFGPAAPGEGPAGSNGDPRRSGFGENAFSREPQDNVLSGNGSFDAWSRAAAARTSARNGNGNETQTGGNGKASGGRPGGGPGSASDPPNGEAKPRSGDFEFDALTVGTEPRPPEGNPGGAAGGDGGTASRGPAPTGARVPARGSAENRDPADGTTPSESRMTGTPSPLRQDNPFRSAMPDDADAVRDDAARRFRDSASGTARASGPTISGVTAGGAATRWGAATAPSAIGLEKRVEVTVTGTAITAGDNPPVPLADAGSPDDVFATLLEAVRRETDTWRTPPTGFRWSPALEVSADAAGRRAVASVRDRFQEFGLRMVRPRPARRGAVAADPPANGRR